MASVVSHQGLKGKTKNNSNGWRMQLKLKLDKSS